MIQVNCRTIECKKLCAIIPEGNGIKRNAPSSQNGANDINNWISEYCKFNLYTGKKLTYLILNNLQSLLLI